ncbi:Serine/threonine-protein phosphatase 7 long form [Glycine soja]
MASSSSSSSSIHIKSGPIEGDVLWLQPKHVSEHVWNGEADRKLHIRRVVPIYQGQEEIPEEIIPLLRQSGFYWIITTTKSSFNIGLLTSDLDKTDVKLNTVAYFHLTETSVQAGNSNVYGFLEPQSIQRSGQSQFESESYIKSWIQSSKRDVYLGAYLNRPDNYLKGIINSALKGLDDTPQPKSKAAARWIVVKTNLDWAELCEELLGVRPQEGELQGSLVKLSWLAHHFSEINIHDGNIEQLQRFTRAWILRFIGGVLFVDKSSSKVSLRYLQFLRDFEQCRTYAWGPAVLAYLYREMCSATDYKIKSIGGEVTETLQYMVSPQGRNTWTIDDLVPYVEKLAILSQEQERITEPVAHGPAPERRFPPQQFHMLQSSVETRGFDRRREIVQAEDFSQHMEQRGHGMYYTPPTFAQYPLQMYQYPFEGHDTDMSASEHSFGGVAETQPHFSWPTMTPSQQHDAPMATPNAPLGQQWDVPGAIPAMGDLLGVDLRHEFSAEAEEQGRRQRARRNPDRQARRWDRPCGTSSRHHGHHDD